MSVRVCGCASERVCVCASDASRRFSTYVCVMCVCVMSVCVVSVCMCANNEHMYV